LGYQLEQELKKMLSLAGEFEVKIDERGRFKLPQKLIEQLGNGRKLDFILNRGFDKNIMMYPREVWEQKTKEINQLSIYDKKERQALRYYYRGVTEVSNDTADRILIPSLLMEYAGIQKDLVILAFTDIIEIWSKEDYERMIENEPDDFDATIQAALTKSRSLPQ
jgi:MraZ protein